MVTKEQIYRSFSDFINTKIDGILGENPFAKLMKPAIQRMINNTIDKNTSGINKVLTYLEDKDGKIDLEGILDDTLNQFDTMPMTSYRTDMLGNVKIGEGSISFDLDLPFISTLRRITLNRHDVLEFIETLKQNAYV